MHSEKQLWSKDLCTFNFYVMPDPISIYQPHRPVRRPRMRWDDHIQQFCEFRFDNQIGEHWSEILRNKDLKRLEREFVNFVTHEIID